MRRATGLGLGFALVTACSGGEEGPFQEMADAGLDRYLGAFTPELREDFPDGTTTYRFPLGDDTPMCMDGTAFHTMVRDLGNDDIILYFQGGGACWSEVCVSPRTSMVRFPDVDLLDPFEPSNPVAGWSSVVVPYCDGSFLMGEIDIPEGADPYAPRRQHGLRNLSAALDVLKSVNPDPARLLVVGASGGGYGALLGLPVVRMAFPNAKMFVLHDSGAGIARPDDAGFIPQIVDELGGVGVLPESCAGCFDDGHITTLVGWQLERDENLVIGDYSTWQDFLIADVFLQIGGDAYATALDEQTSRLAEAWPGRYARFIEQGNEHTSTSGDITGVFGIVPPELAPAVSLIGYKTLRTAEIEGVDVGDWIGSMLASDGWVNLTDPLPGEGEPE